MTRTRNVADENQVKENKKKVDRERQKQIDDVKAVLKIPEGRRFIWRYLALCDRISANNSGSWTYFNEGERNICNKIKADVLAASPEAFLQMMIEQKEENEKNG